MASISQSFPNRALLAGAKENVQIRSTTIAVFFSVLSISCSALAQDFGVPPRLGATDGVEAAPADVLPDEDPATALDGSDDVAELVAIGIGAGVGSIVASGLLGGAALAAMMSSNFYIPVVLSLPLILALPGAGAATALLFTNATWTTGGGAALGATGGFVAGFSVAGAATLFVLLSQWAKPGLVAFDPLSLLSMSAAAGVAGGTIGATVTGVLGGLSGQMLRDSE